MAPQNVTFKNAYKVRKLEANVEQQPVPHSFIFCKRSGPLGAKNKPHIIFFLVIILITFADIMLLPLLPSKQLKPQTS